MRVRALVIRILKQFFHDKRTLALMIVAPMIILWMMSLVFNGSTYEPKIGTVNVPTELNQKLKDQGAIVTVYDANAAEQALWDEKIDAIIRFDNGAPQVKLEGSDPSKNKMILLLLQKVMQQQNPAAGQAPALNITYLHGSENMASFDNFGPVLIGFFSFFFVFLISGVSFLRERTGGTLERLLASPLRRWEIVIGYVLGYGIFTMFQASLIAWFAIHILGIMMAGSFWYVLLITLLLSMTALTLGTFLSSFANNELQMFQFIPLVVVPQVFFSGLFSLDNVADWLRWLGKIAPLSYGADALRDVMIRGKGWSDIAFNVYVLIGISVAIIIANVFALRKHRKI
ncbi:ABC transporter permease [Paenibacillus sediminis]|uniref:ABC-2 type transport system permease protein n=1 Tax=Paenibacillus sediminis TaxID=664909 RepID=A0ABS4H2P3_9BACL|nr:ABC transporter permease [Paenibacillus sediminis]MBP1936532.1 ABC-2 type transport system permease protein [Paenibacillus sediminis]